MGFQHPSSLLAAIGQVLQARPWITLYERAELIRLLETISPPTLEAFAQAVTRAADLRCPPDRDEFRPGADRRIRRAQARATVLASKNRQRYASRRARENQYGPQPQPWVIPTPEATGILPMAKPRYRPYRDKTPQQQAKHREYQKKYRALDPKKYQNIRKRWIDRIKLENPTQYAEYRRQRNLGEKNRRARIKAEDPIRWAEMQATAAATAQRRRDRAKAQAQSQETT